MPKSKDVDAVVGEGGGVEMQSASTVEASVLPTFAEVYAQLSAPFEKTFQRQIPGGRSLTYITTEQVISRLTEVLGGRWQWSVGEAKVIGDDVIVSGTLTISPNTAEQPYGFHISRDGYGGAKVKMGRQSGTPLDLGNDVKAAESSAFKRAARLFGVGLDLYEKTEGGENELPSSNQSYGQQGSYTPAANRQQVQFAQAADGGVTGVIQAKSANGVNIGGTWYNTSKFNPVDLGPYQKGMTVTIQHAPGRTFIDGISVVGGAPAEEVEAF